MDGGSLRRRVPGNVGGGALVSIYRDAGNAGAALAHARELAELIPDEPGLKQLVVELERAN